MALSHRAYLILEQAKADKAAYLASPYNLYAVCEKSDPAAAEVADELRVRDFKLKLLDGKICVAKDLAGPDDVYQPPIVLPDAPTSLAQVVAILRANGMCK